VFETQVGGGALVGSTRALPSPTRRIADHPLTATAALAWNGDVPRPLQQILFDAADGPTPPAPASLPSAC